MAANQGVTPQREALPLSTRRRAGLALLLVPPMSRLVVAYLGSLAVLLISSFCVSRWSSR